ncbi:HD domain-containing protein [Paenibacillus hamazuiensis]|uniref:HD domain-containing protein n=1 Tax=Paenibacillus hamazuiensis TaxID=2936508 RepID=UPI00200ED4ED|nr:HD domain-containing protein [Paenibacillus hamazuiensis]
MPIIDRAIEFAAKAHEKQRRKGTDIPYISHPFAVGMLLVEAGCSEEVVAAGLLHDTLEDTEVTEEELEAHFGPRVLEIVRGCSEPDKSAPWEERKRHTLEFLQTAPLAVRQVACADKLHNLRTIRRDLEQMGEKAWDKFKRGRDSQKWYYEGIVDSLGHGAGFPLLEALRAEVARVFGKGHTNHE